MSGDTDLRGRFESLRRQDAARAPAFEHVLLRSVSSRPAFSRRMGILAAAACLVLAVAALDLRLAHERGRRLPATGYPALADWRAPTDFLLNTPGGELLRAVPRFGEPSSGGAPSRPDIDHTPARRAGTEIHS